LGAGQSIVKRSLLRFIVLSLLASCRNYFLATVFCIKRSSLVYPDPYRQHITLNKTR
jgi:hypothetical protein